VARHGGVGFGLARRGKARQGHFGAMVAVPRILRSGKHGRGAVRSGAVWFGKVRCHLVGELRIVPAASEFHGEVGHGGERIGTARL